MHKSPYRLMAKYFLTGILPVIFVTIFFSCDKSPADLPPQISFLLGAGLTSTDTVLTAGQKVKIGIHASKGSVNLTYFSVRFNDGTNTILLDSGMNTASLNYTLDVIKTTAPVETWSFVVMDRNRVERSINLVLTKSDSSAWGKIRTMNDIQLGAQENPAPGSFFSLNENLVMNLQQAFGNQSSADLVYYYGQYEATLASPNEAEAPAFFTGPQGIANWTIKNETRYDTTMITPQMFDLVQNDSLILAAYEPTAGKKKGKYLVPGMVLSFKSPAGKLGLIKIHEVAPLPAGAVKFTVKIQE